MIGTGSVSMAGTSGTLGNSCVVGRGSLGMSIGVLVGICGGRNEMDIARWIGSWESLHCAARRSHGSYSTMAGLISLVGVSVAFFVRSTLIFGFVDCRFARCAFM